MLKFQNLNHALIGLSRLIQKEGVERQTRGLKCKEVPYPVMFCIENPRDRYINIPDRKWNPYLPFAESLWIARGRNDIKLVKHYVKNLADFSDDGFTMRAGYGARFRSFSGIADDYVNVSRETEKVRKGLEARFTNLAVVDQLRFVIESFKRDINTRQACISIHDPVKDCFDIPESSSCLMLKQTKDQPCTRLIQFMIVDGKLDCTVYLRSNDLIWGLSAVNVTNFTIMQEYVSLILGVEIGKYYHIANNLHVYEEFYNDIELFSKMNENDFMNEEIGYDKHPYYTYSLQKFDEHMTKLEEYEESLRENKPRFCEFDFSLFYDWKMVLKHHYNKKNKLEIKPEEFDFYNPYLRKLLKIG